MEIFIILFFFLLGLIVGSFLNVVILRYNTGKSLKGRSACLSCRAGLAWFELIPLASFIYQKGKCRHCQSHISLQYPIIETVTAIIFAFIAYNFLPDLENYFSIWLLLEIVWLLTGVSLLIVIAGYDIRHKIIPDRMVWILALISFVAPFIVYDYGLYFSGNRMAGGLLAGALLYFFFWVIWKYSKGEWMGLGDAKLAFAVGLFLGFEPGLTALVLAFWLGAVVGLVAVAISRITSLSRYKSYLTIKSEMPFAPFIAAGAVLQLIFDFNVFDYF